MIEKFTHNNFDYFVTVQDSDGERALHVRRAGDERTLFQLSIAIDTIADAKQAGQDFELGVLREMVEEDFKHLVDQKLLKP